MADRRKGGLSRARGGPRPWARYRKWARGSTAFNRETDFLTACEAAVKDKTFDINGRYSLSIEIVVSSSESQEIFVLVPEISMWRWRIFFISYFYFSFNSWNSRAKNSMKNSISHERETEGEGGEERERIVLRFCSLKLFQLEIFERNIRGRMLSLQEAMYLIPINQ